MTDRTRVVVEVCVDDVESALLADREGADRIEPCAALSEGGLTPNLGLVWTVLGHIGRLGMQVMIRARGGDVVISPLELAVYLRAVRSMV